MINKILVVGATGQQGGAVVDALSGSDIEVFGLTRNTGSEKAKTLMAKGVKLITGDLTDKESLKAILGQFDSIFLVTTPFEKGVENEVIQGVNLIDAAIEADIDHIVFSSVADANILLS